MISFTNLSPKDRILQLFRELKSSMAKMEDDVFVEAGREPLEYLAKRLAKLTRNPAPGIGAIEQILED